MGPLLFVIHVNDVVTLFGPQIYIYKCGLGMCKLYADDLKLYMHVTSVTLRFQLTELLGQVGSLVTNMAA